MHEHLKTNWSRTAVVYQIYPRSFKDTNGDGVGDLRGIIEKLNYLNDGTDQSLGIDAIWLNPIYKSPQHDFGYDIADYFRIDPLFGTLKDFDELVRGAHERGIRIIMDFVANHTSDEHPWFKESRSDKHNPKRDWYIWHAPGKGGGVPNNWLSRFGGSAWALDEGTGEYYLHSFLPSQPDLNWANPDVRAQMEEIMEFWLHRGVDGFRTDAIHYLLKDQSFRDNPPNPNYRPGEEDPFYAQLHQYDRSQPQIFEIINTLCNVLGNHENKFMVSETSTRIGIKEMTKFYNACSNKLHAPFNFHLLSLPWSAGEYKKFIDEFESSLPVEDIPNYVLGNHDTHRVATRFGKERARLVALMMFTLRGMPFIYYGDELGMEDGVFGQEDAHDPWGKNVPGYSLSRDPERTPMQWSSGKNAGFTNGKPWLPIHQNYEKVNVEVQEGDPRSMLSFYRRLIHLRKHSHPILYGSYQSIDVDNPEIFAYMRTNETRLLIVMNFSKQEQLARFPSFAGTYVCGTHVREANARLMRLDPLRLRPYEGVIIKLI